MLTCQILRVKNYLTIINENLYDLFQRNVYNAAYKITVWIICPVKCAMISLIHSCTVEVWEWISNFILHSIMDVNASMLGIKWTRVNKMVPNLILPEESPLCSISPRSVVIPVVRGWVHTTPHLYFDHSPGLIRYTLGCYPFTHLQQDPLDSWRDHLDLPKWYSHPFGFYTIQF